jgi:DNA-directed RNA polymerase subunit RPC12/RpoP
MTDEQRRKLLDARNLRLQAAVLGAQADLLALEVTREILDTDLADKCPECGSSSLADATTMGTADGMRTWICRECDHEFERPQEEEG